VYVTVGGILIEGSQNNLQLIPLGLVGLTLATLVWASLVILLGTLSKSSLVAALGSFGVWIGVTIAGSILSVFRQPYYSTLPGVEGQEARRATKLERGRSDGSQRVDGQ